MRRTHANPTPTLKLTPYAVQPVIKGGTGGVNLNEAIVNLDLIPKTQLGQPNGILSKVNGKIPTSVISNTLIPTVNGKRQLFLTEVGTYTITNYDSNTNYTVTTTNGTVTRSGETITYMPPNAIGQYSFVLNGKTYLVDVINGVVNKPSITSPTNNASGQAQLLSASSSSFSYSGLNDTHLNSDWQIASDINFTNVVASVNASNSNKTTWTLTSPLVKSTSYYIRARHRGVNYGVSPWSDPVLFTTSSPGDVTTPSITSPSNNAVNIAITFNAIGSAFAINGTDTHEATDWELATDSAFTNVFKSSYNDNVNKTSYTFNGLSNSVTYYLRTRYKGVLAGWSAYSPTIKFTTIPAASINTPTITSPSNGATGQSTSPSFTSSSFSVSNGTDTHASSDWQIATDSSFSNLVKNIVGDSMSKTTWNTSGLANNSTYYVRVRHRGTTLGYGSWSAPSTFTTVAAPSIVTPSITSPSNGTTGVNSSVSITTSSFSVVNGSDTHVGTDWQIATDANFNNLVVNIVNDNTNKLSYSVSNLVAGTTYYVRVRYKGNTLGYSGWSTAISFVTKTNFTPTAEIAKLLASDGQPNDQFGYSVALSSDGNTAIIGAHGDDDKTTNAGAAYIFVRTGTNWSYQAKLLASDGQASDYFGWSVAISGDGNTAIIGAYGDDDKTTDAGAAYIYVRTGTNWSYQAKLLASDGQGSDNFGISVALSSDGNTAIIGAYGDDDKGDEAGSAYIYVRSGTSWSYQAKLLASDGQGGDQFGWSVALSSDGNTAIIGAYLDDDKATNAGAAYIFVRTGTNWSYQAKLLASDGQGSDYFGNSVALSSDGNTAIIGAHGDDDKGTDAGAAYIFIRSGTDWTQQTKLLASDGETNDNFGRSVAISGDGNTAIIGVYVDDNERGNDAGSAYIFIRSGTDWTYQAKLLASDGQGSDYFGNSVALSSDGNTAIIGAYLDDDKGTNAGAAYIFA